MEGWNALSKPPPATIEVRGVELRAGSRVRLRPRTSGDVLAVSLEGKTATVDSIEQDLEDQVFLAVTLEGDPARSLAKGRQLGHRFYFPPSEVEPLSDDGRGTARILVAGIGNIFMGDDGFGVEVARRLAERKLPEGVAVAEFGIRGMDLAYTLGEGYDAAVLIDASPRGQAPGTLEVIEPELGEVAEIPVEGHGMDPLRVFALAQRLAALPERVLVLGCEPQEVVDLEASDEIVVELSAPVSAAVEPAADLVESLVRELAAQSSKGGTRR